MMYDVRESALGKFSKVTGCAIDARRLRLKLCIQDKRYMGNANHREQALYKGGLAEQDSLPAQPIPKIDAFAQTPTNHT